MDWALAAKIIGVLTAALQGAALQWPQLQGSITTIITILGVLSAVVATHVHTVTQATAEVKASIARTVAAGGFTPRMPLLLLLLAPAVLALAGCSALVLGGSAAGAAATGGLVYTVLNFPFTATILYYIGKEGALVIMPNASTAVDKDVIMACQDARDYLNNAAGLPAEVVNQVITAKFAGLDPTVLAAIQSYAAQLGQYVPSAGVILTAAEVTDISKFVQGWQDGTTSVLGSTPASMAEKLAACRKHLAEAKGPGRALRASPSNAPGWLCAQKEH